jgi:hypothetical protein
VRLGRRQFGRAGDRDGRGGDGENPARFFQRFPCGPGGTAGLCNLRFGVRSSLGADEIAWVRIAPAERGEGELGHAPSVWRLPDTGGKWEGPVSVSRPGCGAEIFVEFGILGRDGAPVAGTVDIDDVRGACVEEWGASTLAQDTTFLDLLPPLPPDPAAGEIALPRVIPRGPTGVGVLALVLAGLFAALFAVLIARNTREPGTPARDIE